MHRRRRAWGAGLAGLAALMVLGFAGSARATPDEPFAGSSFDAPYDGSHAVANTASVVSATIRYQPYAAPDTTTTTDPPDDTPKSGYVDQVDLSVELADEGTADACPQSLGSTTTYPSPEEGPGIGKDQIVTVGLPVTFDCNGRYRATTVSHVQEAGDRAPEVMTTTFDVAIPPPPVQNVVATTTSSHHVDITWDAVSVPAPDFVGYIIQRKVDGGAFARIGVERKDTSFTDERVPVQGGELSYRVLGVRTAHGNSFVTSSEADSAPATLTVAGLTTTSAPKASGRSGSRPFKLKPPPVPTTADTGFDESLPYPEDGLPGESAQSPDDDLASVLYDDGAEPKGFLIPTAIALVMITWAMHLRYLARRAAQPL